MLNCEEVWMLPPLCVINKMISLVSLLLLITVAVNIRILTCIWRNVGVQCTQNLLVHVFLNLFTFHTSVHQSQSAAAAVSVPYQHWRPPPCIRQLKDVCHIWELGGGTTYTPLLETPLKAERLPSLGVLLVVDLTKPHTMWATLETMLKVSRGW